MVLRTHDLEMRGKDEEGGISSSRRRFALGNTLLAIPGQRSDRLHALRDTWHPLSFIGFGSNNWEKSVCPRSVAFN